MRRPYRAPRRFASQLPRLTEARFLKDVREAARLAGWETYHTLNSKGSEPGWPDLVLAKPGRVLMVELKTDHGRLTRAQQKWLRLLATCPGLEVAVWRPADWEKVLATLGLLSARVSVTLVPRRQRLEGALPTPAQRSSA